MGYQTDYSLKVLNTRGEFLPETTRTLVHALQEKLGDAVTFNPCGSSDGNEQRWYEHEADMREFSRQASYFVFALHGEGEEKGDIWTKYFHNGKMQVERASLQIAPFDPAKLK